MLSIEDDFDQIDREYKKFKENIFRNWCEASELSIQKEEKMLIQSINKFLNIQGNKISSNQKIAEDNLIKALICTRILSKYSFLNQEECIRFFTVIGANNITSIHKRLFFIKCVAKQCKNKNQYLWREFILNFKNKTICVKKENDNIETIKNSLIYIHFLIQYAPDYVIFNSIDIFNRLFQIIQKEETEYTLDLNYNIFSYTNETLDTYFDTTNNNKKFFANYAIELFQMIFEKVDILLIKSIDINSILSWKQKNKKHAILSVLFSANIIVPQKVSDSIFNEINESDINDTELQCLFVRNIIYCSTFKNDFDVSILQNKLSTNVDKNENVTCGNLQNIKLLIEKKPDLLSSIFQYNYQQEICAIIANCLGEKGKILSNALDLLNCFCANENYESIEHGIIDALLQLDLPIDYINVINFMLEKMNENFIQKLNQSFHNNALKTFKFLDGLIRENKEMTDNIIDLINDQSISDEDKRQIEKNVFNFNNDSEIALFAPFVASTFFPERFYSVDKLNELFHIVLCDFQINTKISILKFFNKTLNKGIITNYELVSFFKSENINSVFKIFAGDFSHHELQIETIKLICKLHVIDPDLKYENIILTFADFFSYFQIESNSIITNIENYSLSFKRISYIYDFLSDIFDSYPDYCEKYFLPFFNFTNDFINLIIADKSNYENSSKLLSIKPPKTLFQHKFYQSAFCSSLKCLFIILKTKANIVRPYFSTIIVSCTNILQGKIEQMETQSILVLLDEVFDKMELKEVIQMQEKRIINKNLYTIIFEAGTRFKSPIISEHVFKILGFLGAQTLFKNPKPIYEDYDEKNKMNSELISQIFKDDSKNSDNMFILKFPDNIYYVICANYIFKIFEEENLKHSHFYALEALIKMQTITKSNCLYDHFSRCLQYFNFIFNEGEIQNKQIFVPLFKLLIDVVKNAIEKEIEDIKIGKNEMISKEDLQNEFANKERYQKYLNEIVSIFQNLWEYDISDSIISLAETFKTGLQPFLGTIITLVRSMKDRERIADLLFIIYKNCCTKKSNNPFNNDIIGILIQMIEQKNYSIIPKLSAFLKEIRDISKHIFPIIHMCINLIKGINSNDANIDDIVNLLCELTKTIRRDTKTYFDRFIPAIKKALQPFKEKTEQFEKALVNMKRTASQFAAPHVILRMRSNEKKYQPLFTNNFDNKDEFMNIIMKVTQNEINPLFVQQWLDELKHFCFDSSPHKIIKCISKLFAKNNIFEEELFITCFHSCLYYLYIHDIDRNNIIKTVEIALLKALSKSSSKSHAIITNIIEFFDRFGLRIFASKDFELPIASTFSNKPPISLRFALLNFEKQIQNAKNDLQLAYLNVGMLDKYQEFSRIFNLPIDIRYRLPIFTGSNEDRSHIERANALFVDHFEDKDFLDNFNKEIDQCQHKVISHIFKATALLHDFLFKMKKSGNISDEMNEQKMIILSEIDQGFRSLGVEDGPRFSHGFTSVLQSIVYAQQLVELKEMILTNSAKNDVDLRFTNSNSIMNFLPPVLLLRIYAKGKIGDSDSLLEKLQLLSLCRKSNRWDLMKNYCDLFGFDSD